jgi:hypothetical protein
VRLGVNVQFMFASVARSSIIVTNIEAKEGQKTVLTKTNVAGTEDAVIR